MTIFTLSKIAALIADAESRPLETVHLQCRALSRSGRIAPYARAGRTDIYTEREALRAVVLSATVENGISGDELSAVAKALDSDVHVPNSWQPSDAEIPDWGKSGESGIRLDLGLEVLMKAARAKDDWVLSIRRNRRILDSSIDTDVQILPQVDCIESSLADKALRLKNGWTPVGHTIIYASIHLQNVLPLLEQDA